MAHTHGRATLAILLALATAAGAQPTADDVPVPKRLDAAADMVESVVIEAIDAARANPASPDAWLALARTYHANAYNAEAETCYEEALALGTDDPRTWHLLAHARRSRGDTDGAIEAATTAIATTPTYAPSRWRRADWRLEQGDAAGAEADYRAALEIDPGAEAARFGLALVSLQRRDPDAVLTGIDETLLQGANAKYAHMLRGRALAQLGRTDEAAAELALARGAQPSFADPWVNELHTLSTGYVNEMNHILALMRQGRNQEAIDKIDELRKHYPRDVLSLEYKASALWSMGRRPEAARTWQEAINLDPTNYHPHLTFARTSYAGLPPDNPIFKLALMHAFEAVRLNQGDAESRELLGTILATAGQFNDAARALENAVRLDPADAGTRGKLAEVYMRLARYDDAIEQIRRAIELAPDTPPAYLLLAAAAIESGRMDLAAEAIAGAEQRLPPDDPRLAALRRRLGPGANNPPPP